MIVFDLVCANDHTFEAWFPDSKDFERQKRKKAVSCPFCGGTDVEKALMAPNIATSKTKDKAADQNKALMAAKLMTALAEVRKQVEENCDYVGPQFAEEARKIHLGETEKRDIYGEATREEAEELREEGVEFGEIPWVPRLDS